jgi:hypothetical protein
MADERGATTRRKTGMTFSRQYRAGRVYYEARPRQRGNHGISRLEESMVRHFSRRQISNGAEATANMGEPSEREALLTILLNMLARKCFGSYLALGCERTLKCYCAS